MAEIYPAVKDCDVVVFATPLYYWNMSGQIRTAVDRLFALEEGGENLLREENPQPFSWRRRVTALRMCSSTMTTLWSISGGKTWAMFWREAIWIQEILKESRSLTAPLSWENP